MKRPMRPSCARRSAISTPASARSRRPAPRRSRLARYASAWDAIRDAARETEVFNFDKRALVLGIFDRLAKAEAG